MGRGLLVSNEQIHQGFAEVSPLLGEAFPDHHSVLCPCSFFFPKGKSDTQREVDSPAQNGRTC